jgi:hypothetical protein
MIVPQDRYRGSLPGPATGVPVNISLEFKPLDRLIDLTNWRTADG